MVTREDMLLFLERNSGVFCKRLVAELERNSVGTLSLVTQGPPLAPDGHVYLNEQTCPELFKAIKETTGAVVATALVTFIDAYSEEVGVESQACSSEPLNDIRTRLDNLEKRFIDTFPPTWTGEPPTDDSLN